MIFMQQMQYNATNRMYVFQHLSRNDTLGSHFGLASKIRAPPLQNHSCISDSIPHYYTMHSKIMSVDWFNKYLQITTIINNTYFTYFASQGQL